MVAHLEHHRKLGDKVPARAFTRLKEEQKEKHNLYPATNHRKLTKNIRRSKNELLEQKLYKEMQYHRKQMVQTAIEVFEDIYRRKPNALELPGLADAADIKTDLMLNQFNG